ncbi:MAG: type VI secretion system tip protein VgrG [Deltaproteobacteria bacterium]|nr:type VI secretion system tip protein VgrG [Deltaproteobacteria bacterium]
MTTPLGVPIEAVRYAVHVDGGPDPGWDVRRLRLSEAISEPYALSLDLIAHVGADDIDIDELLGAELDLEIERGPVCRTVCGLIHRVSSLGAGSDEFMVQVEVVPAFSYLVHHVDTRIFQDQTVPEILEQVLGTALGQYGRKLDASRLHDHYIVRDYCVQYAESVFDFASRLMEEEGISYLFEPEQDNGKLTGVELMVLLDQAPGKPNADFEEIEGIFEAEVSLITNKPETADEESLQTLEWTRPERANKVAMRRFNWKQPAPDAIAQAQLAAPPRRSRVREIYIPEDRRRVQDKRGDDAYTGTTTDEDEALSAQRRFELLTDDGGWGKGTSNLVGMVAGGTFTLSGHAPTPLAGSKLLVTRVVHIGSAPETERGAAPEGLRFHGSFECTPAQVPLRPALDTKRPRILGPQTAIVTGPPGEEIHTDRHGRIKVHFHWDRVSPFDDTASCWVRVAQSVAGPGWGSWSLPRVGMEVVVDFLDGNPDRPLVTGCVYNGDNQPPCALPQDKTKTTIKSRSSPGGGGSNELRFEDAAGHEEVYFHAQKDHNEVVGNDHTRTVRANETVSVGGDQAMTISGNRVVVVDGQDGQAPHYSITVKDDYSLAAAKTVLVKAEEKITLQCKTTFIELTPDAIVLQAGENGSRIQLDIEALVQSKHGGKVHLDEVGNVVARAKDEASLSLTNAAIVRSKPGAKVELTGEATVAAAQDGASLVLNADATMQGNTVDLTSEGAQLELTTAALLTSVHSAAMQAPTVSCLGESVAKVGGTTVEVLGVVLTTVKGAAVKIN